MSETALDQVSPDPLAPIAWLTGHWEGSGNGTTDSGEYDCAVTVDFASNGGDYLHYVLQWFETDDAGVALKSLGMESGFWRMAADGGVESVIAAPHGVAEILLGSITGARIELTSDVVARTASAVPPVTASHRLLGNVDGDLMFVFEQASDQAELAPYLWARLVRQ
ncbi:MAG: FABP family protein [Propionibacteriaceae bacterium]|jgi:hypothetical protein|nr:FABP family protein [Propionibacteriaceae bacterium]